MVVALAAFAVGCRSKAGDACDRGTGACLDARTELACQGGRFVAAPCKGSRGCASDGATVTCDVSANAEGDVCSTEDEGKGSCSPDAKSQIACRSGAYRVIACRGPEGCKPTASGSTCDTSVAEEGDRCSAAGQACTPDRQRLLTCIGGRYVGKWTCRGAEGCRDTGDGNLTCDLSVALPGDACTAEGGACSTDRKQLLRCKGGAFVVDLPCRGPEGCKDEGGGNLKCDNSIAEPGDPCTSDGAGCSPDGKSLVVCKGGKFVVETRCRCVVTGDSVRCR